MVEQNIQQQEEVTEVAEAAAVAAAEATWPQTRAILRIIFVVLAVAAIIWTLYTLEGVILLVVLAIFFAYLIAPLVDLVRKTLKVKGSEPELPRELPRVLAIGIVYLVIFTTLGTTIYLLLPSIGRQLSEFAHSSPEYLTNARERAGSLNRLYDRLQLPPGVRTTANDAVDRAFRAVEEYGTGKGLSDLLADAEIEITLAPPGKNIYEVMGFVSLRRVLNVSRLQHQLAP